ncbi:monocarboxylate transporter 3 isoform X2 [Schistocerca gregaria]|uniref:monocarboxylate transporter 3 isoform X2 n=1 Tax=Schistocerca gregaria TaxID=7010 RepID=UPI00211EDACF|nr:monocarboxylate transporter 3 isoform X2 [Schistocerca gregaria]
MGPASSREAELADSGLDLAVPPHTESQCSCSERAQESARLTAQDDDGSPGDEDALSFCEYHDVPPPPDGGYGWVIVFASFMCNMIVDGIAYTFGIFLGEFVNYYGEGKGKTAWVGSLLSGMYLSAGPVVSALTNKYGCRAVCIAGSIIGCAAFVLSIFSPNVNVLMLTYGVMGGIGFGLIYLPAVVCVGYYFETKRSLATGIAVCGSGFGTFAFAPVATILLETFGWKGSNLVLAGVILNCAVFGAMMRPLEYQKVPSCKPLLQRMAEEKRFQMERGSIGGSYFMVMLPDGTMERRLKMPINIDPGVHSSFNLDQLAAAAAAGGGVVAGGATPLTPVPTVPTLPTISEVKAPEQSGSSGASSAGSGELRRRQADEASPERDQKALRDDARPAIPRNASQPAFTTHVQGLPKNGSVPFFDRIRKTSAGERYRPTLGAIKVSRGNVSSNGDIRKSLHLRLSNSSVVAGSRNNNCEEMWSKTDIGENESICFTTSKSSIPREKREIVRPLSRKDIFYSGSVINLPEYKSQKSLTSYRQSVISLPKYPQDQIDIEGEGGGTCSQCCPESFRTILGTMMDMSLLKDPVFMLISVSNLFGMMGLYVPFVYLVDAAILDGTDSNSASFLLSIIGITNTVGRVACGYLADFPWMDSLLLNNICLVVCTFAVAATPFCHTYAAYVAMAIFFGLAVSGYISLTSIILVDLLGLDKLTNAFGLLILFRGGAAIVGSPLAGAVYDATKSYAIPFYMAAAFFLVSAVTSFLAPSLKRCLASPAAPPIPDALTPINEDVEEENEPDVVPEIIETAPSPSEIKQIESVL